MKRRKSKDKPRQYWIRNLFGIVLLLIIVLFVLPTYAIFAVRHHVYAEGQAVPSRSVGIVLGGGVKPSGEPLAILKARIETGVDLYKAGTVKKLLMSGDASSAHHDEPTAMKDYAIELGIPSGDIVMDPYGLNTYDTCYRAKQIYGVTDAIIVSQGYHMPRAVFTCRKLGIDAVGVGTSRYFSIYSKLIPQYSIRELFGINLVTYKLYVTHPKATYLGEQEPIKY